jgi:hypothetical protein
MYIYIYVCVFGLPREIISAQICIIISIRVCMNMHVYVFRYVCKTRQMVFHMHAYMYIHALPVTAYQISRETCTDVLHVWHINRIHMYAYVCVYIFTSRPCKLPHIKYLVGHAQTCRMPSTQVHPLFKSQGVIQLRVRVFGEPVLSRHLFR